jgi:hypothetical protein
MSEFPTVHAGLGGTIDLAGDLTVNRLGFGAMRVTGAGIWGPPADRDEAKAVLRRAVELGTNFIDTADSYGPHISEELIHEALHPYPDDLVIATKGGLERTGPGQWPANGRPEHLLEACEGSLRRLELEQIPLTSSTGLTRLCRWRTRSVPWSPSRNRARSDTSDCPTSLKTSYAGHSASPRSCRSRIATTSTTVARSRWSTFASRSRWFSCPGRRSRILTATGQFSS